MLQAALRSGAAAAPLRLRGLRPPPARGPPLRRRGRHRPAARGDRGLPLRRGGARPRCASADVVDEQTLDFLAGYRFTGDISGYAEGECYFPGSPLVRGRGLLRRGRAAGDADPLDPQPRRAPWPRPPRGWSRAAGDRPCLEMGSRRTHEQAAVAAARAAYVAGFAATSNLEAGRRYGVPTAGHQRARVHPAARRRAGPRSRRRWPRLGKDTTLLVDTYDVAAAVRDRGRGRRPGARRGAAGLRRPADPGRRGPGPAGRPRRHATPGSW